MDAAGVSRAVLVQHLGEFDNSYLGGIAAAEPKRFAAVCLVDHTRSDAPDTLNALADSGQFKGVRLTTEVLHSAPRVAEAAVDAGLTIVLYAPDGIAGAVPALTRFLDLRPNSKVVLTHLGKPNLAEAPGFAEYRAAFRLARYPAVYYQVSGMKMYCPFPHQPLYELLREAAEAFGPQRMVWGSNYPVVGSAEDYRADLSLLVDGKLPIPPAAIPEVAGANALRLWFEDHT